MCLGGREWGAGCSPTAPAHRAGACTLNAVGLLPVSRAWRCEGRPPPAPPLCVCGDVYLTLPYRRPSSTTSSTGPTSQTTSRTLAPRSGSGRDRPRADRDRAEIAPPASSEIKLAPRSPEIAPGVGASLQPAPSFATGGPLQPRRLLRAAGGAAALDGVHPARPRPLREAREAARRKAPRGVRRGEVQ